MTSIMIRTQNAKIERKTKVLRQPNACDIGPPTKEPTTGSTLKGPKKNASVNPRFSSG